MNIHPQPQGDPSSVTVHPLLLQSPVPSQPVLVVTVHEDDLAFLARQDVAWAEVIWGLDWRPFRHVAALYYQALWEFNQAAARERRRRFRAGEPVGNPEDEEQAVLRLLYERPTGGNTEAPILHPTPAPPRSTPMVCEEGLEPGVVPFRRRGREPKDFFALFKAFLIPHLMGKAASAEEVHDLLTVSPSLARGCGFTIPDATGKYRRTDIPKLRKLEQFDQIMCARGLWSDAKVKTVRDNLADGTIPLEERQPLVHDTTHFPAYSAMAVVTLPASPATSASSDSSRPKPALPEPVASPERSSSPVSGGNSLTESVAAPQSERSRRTKRAGKKKSRRKSQSRTVKSCRCPDRQSCPHPWELSDPGAGTVVKGSQSGGKRMYWAHKAAVMSLASGIPLDAVAMMDAASHDSGSLRPHLRRLFKQFPELKDEFREVLADSAYDDQQLREDIAFEFSLALRTPLNPRGRKSTTLDLGRGMRSLSPIGTLTCEAGEEMTYRGVRWDTEKFLYGPPVGEDGVAACETCPVRNECCRDGAQAGRHVAIAFEKLPHIDPQDPPMARRFKVLMNRRPAIERVIKRLKIDLGDPHLTRRGNDAFQGHLDRSMLAFHLLLRAT